MAVQARCQKCGHTFQVVESALGSGVNCPGCGLTLRLPKPPSSSDAPAYVAPKGDKVLPYVQGSNKAEGASKPRQGKPLAEVIRGVGIVRGALISSGVLIVLILVAFGLERGCSSGLEEAKLSRLEQRIAGLEKTLESSANRIELQAFKEEMRENQLKLATACEQELQTVRKQMATLYANQQNLATAAEAENIKGKWELLKEEERQRGETLREALKSVRELSKPEPLLPFPIPPAPGGR